MVIRNRSELVQHTDIVQLHVTFRSLATGLPADLATFPTLTLIQPSGNVLLGPTSAGVYRLTTGVYGYDYTVGINAPIGVWTDLWRGTIDGYNLVQELKWVVQDTNLPGVNTDGYLHLGDDPGFNYSQTEIQNINKLLKALKKRLNSSGKSVTTDQFGNPMYHDCDIYDTETLVTFLAMSLTEFNQIPTFTNFTFSDTDFINQFFAILVQGATLYALASKALIERGREFSITDSGVSFSPPTVSELLNTQWSAELSNHYEKLKFIKNSMRPAPQGLGGMSIANSRNPAINRLRFLRARQLF